MALIQENEIVTFEYELSKELKCYIGLFSEGASLAEVTLLCRVAHVHEQTIGKTLHDIIV